MRSRIRTIRPLRGGWRRVRVRRRCVRQRRRQQHRSDGTDGSATAADRAGDRPAPPHGDSHAGRGRREPASSWPSTRGPVRRSTPTSPRSCSESKLGTPTELVDIDENADVGRPRRRRPRRQPRDLAVGSRRRPQDLHRREEDRRRHRPARPDRQDRLVRTDVRHRRAPRAEDVGRLQGSRRSPSCSRPPSPAIRASS